MLSLILLGIAWWQEGKMDAMYEAYKWDVSRRGPDFKGRQWDSYNPMLPSKGIWGIKRDGWHFSKAKLWACVILAFPVFMLEIWLLHGIISPFFYLLHPVFAVITRGIVFESSLAKARKKYRPDTES